MNTSLESWWVAPGESELCWESWGALHAVFDVRSGETHLLPDPTARVLQRLMVRPGTIREVAETFCVESGEAFNEDSLERIERLFRQLQSVELIEKADS